MLREVYLMHLYSFMNRQSVEDDFFCYNIINTIIIKY